MLVTIIFPQICDSLFCVFGVADAIISLNLKFYSLSRINFLYWEANLPSIRINFNYVN